MITVQITFGVDLKPMVFTFDPKRYRKLNQIRQRLFDLSPLIFCHFTQDFIQAAQADVYKKGVADNNPSEKTLLDSFYLYNRK